MRHLLPFRLVLVLASGFESAGEEVTAASTGAPNASAETSQTFSPEEQQRAFKLALAYAEAEEPGLDYRLSRFQVIARDAASETWTVKVYGTPKKGSKWRCASVQFKVFVDPDGKVSEPQWRLRYCW